jgi:TRAP-type C4-dicarboxylate transport system permease small subunit
MSKDPCLHLAVALDRGAARLATAGAVVAAALIVFMTAHVVLEVVLRGAFSTSTFALDEYVGYGTAMVTFLAAGYALQEGALIRVNVLLARLKPDGDARRWLEIICGALSIFVMALLHWYFLVSVIRNFQRGTVSETVAATPLWIPEAVVTAGITILLFRLSAYLFLLFAGGPIIDRAGDDNEQGNGGRNALTMERRQ